MPRDTPYAGVAAIFRSALEAGRAPRVFEDGGQQRDFVHVTDVAEANLRACGRSAGVVAARLQRRLGPPAHRRRHGPRARRGVRRTRSVVTGDYRIGDVRHVVASPLRAEKELGFSARVEFADGMRALRDRPAASRSLITRGCGRRPRRRSPTARRAASQNRCDRGGSVAVAGSSHTRNGSQIRSVSPSTSPEASLTAMPTIAARGRTSSRPRRPARPATTAGPAAIAAAAALDQRK